MTVLDLEDETNIAFIYQTLKNARIEVDKSEISRISFDDNGDVVVHLDHQFQSKNNFPVLKERTDFDAVGNSLQADDLKIGYNTSVTISMVESGAGYNNSLGAYTIDVDGTLKSAQMIYGNVKDPLALDKSVAKIEKTIVQNEKTIARYNDDTVRLQGQAEKLSSPKNAEKLLKVQQQINDKLDSIAKLQEKVTQHRLEIASLEAQAKGTYELDVQSGHEIGFFIIADGNRVNSNYAAYDLENGTLEFIYRFGKADERAAKITDSAADISLVYKNGEQISIIKGNIYHTTTEQTTHTINGDGKLHAVAGLAGADDPDTIRIGFEDLKGLGDADYNDVVFDVRIDSSVITIPATLFINDITGTNAAETLVGTERNDHIQALGGNDVLVGSAGEDTLDGGTGNDTVDYSQMDGAVTVYLTHDYTLKANGSRDTLISIEHVIGSRYNDTLILNRYNNIAYGGAGDDIIHARDGNDTVYGEAGNDRLYGMDGDDTLYGGDGDDRLYGDNTDTDLTGTGNDSLYGGAGNDMLWGHSGDDLLDGGDGNDQMYGMEDNDTFIGGQGNDLMDGGSGFDTVDYSRLTSKVDVYLTHGRTDKAGGETDILRSIEKVIATAYDDSIVLGDSHEEVHGGDGHDTVYARAGNDTIYGDGGDDRLYGMDGDDVIYGGDGNDRLYGDKVNASDTWSGNDTLYGGAGNDTLFGHGGDDILDGGTGADKLYGNEGRDTFVISSLDAADEFMDFTANGPESDRIDITSILSGFDSATDNLNDFVQFVFRSATRTDVLLNNDGAGSDWQLAAIIRTDMSGVTVDDLASNGQIIV